MQVDRKGGGWASLEIEVGVDACGGGDFSLVGVDILTTKTILGLIDFKNFRLRRSYLFKIIIIISCTHHRTSNRAIPGEDHPNTFLKTSTQGYIKAQYQK